jgi:GH15 family glucan-1,4-alpha-glucosidase
METPKLDHAAVGNGRVLALVSPTSAIEWLCLPRFDSPSIFARILDREKGGTFRILFQDREIKGNLQYVRNTNVTTTVFEADEYSWEIVDFAPRIPTGLTVEVPIQLVRIIRPIQGHPRLRIDFDPRPDYARITPDFIQSDHGVEIRGGNMPLELFTNLPVPYVLSKREFVLDRPIYLVLSSGGLKECPSFAEIQRQLDLTIEGWRIWAKTCALPAFASAEVLRSALCLKLHVYHDTGAIIAAATTSIPEAIGTPRTWDYRYCWLRDAAFVVEALRRLGHVREGEDFILFLRDVAESGPLQPVYGIDGERYLPEVSLSHLAGFANNGHVRIGNAAYEQKQNDLMGEIILCLETLLNDPRIVHQNPESYFPLITRMVEEAIVAAPTLDTGIWEFRSLLRPYTFSRAMCWVAISRGAKLARQFRHEDCAKRWESIANQELEIILEHGYNKKLGYFTQGLDGENADAANLLLPTLGLIDARDPRFVSTIDKYAKELVQNGLILRYKNPDDFGATTSAFTICSFWWAEALALVGRLEEAIAIFDHINKFANPLGLFSEDVDPRSGLLLGNFPQSYTHVGLIHAARTINHLLEARDGKVRAWS